ncbi:hypothetical protein PR048_014088 [Dryococelus australis]|uniref:Uncharacterized protein n=1 Tax=Dryococelus australis TaxID=614101 RepID=A0ABQ9HUA9_9NEOP|nr:hypothetical protein PR048_014088 [Dryococelus australis]
MQNKWVVKDKVVTNDIDIDTVEHYIYLGQLINMNGDSMAEIYRCIKLDWRVYGRNSIVFKSNLPVYLKKQVIDQCVLPVLTYACQTWTQICQAKQKLRTAQRGMERAMLGFTRRDRKRTDYIRSVISQGHRRKNEDSKMYNGCDGLDTKRPEKIQRKSSRSLGQRHSESSRCKLEKHCTTSISLEGIRNNLCACLSFVMPRPRSCATDIDTVLQTIRRFKEQIANEDGSIAKKNSDVWTNISESLNYDISSNYAYTIEGEYFGAESDQDEDVLSENSTTEYMNDQQFVVTLSPEEWSRMKPEERITGSKRILKGTRRRSALEELVEKNVSACTVRREEARRSMHLGDNEPSHIPTLDALRLTKSRELKSRRVDDDPILAVGKMKYSAEYYSSIREIELDQFASDATGGINAKLKRPFGKVSEVVYLYSVAVHDHEAGVQYTVANMLSESHNNLRIHHFLESWLRSGAPVPKEAVCDHSVALLSGLSAIDTILDEDNCPKENSFPEEVENEDETPTDFIKWALQIISEVEDNLAEEEGDDDSSHFLPEIVVCIAKLMKFLPL